jgi:hypothetical protein
MAFNQRGAYWVEATEGPRNPYFGEKPFKGQNMLTCGELIERIPPEVSFDSAERGRTDVDPSKTKEGEPPEPKPGEVGRDGHQHGPGGSP